MQQNHQNRVEKLTSDCDEALRSGVAVFAVSWISLMNNLKPLQTITALFSSLGIGVMMPGSYPTLSHYTVCCCRGKTT